MRIGVLVSGSGSNLQALIERVHGHSATIAGVCSSNHEAYALERARAPASRAPSSHSRPTAASATRATARWRTGLPSGASAS